MSIATEFFDSVRTGRVQRLRRLLDENPRLLEATDDNGATAVLEALYYGQPGALDLLLEQGSALNIFEAAALGRAGRLRELLDCDGARVLAVSASGHTALHLAALYGRTDAVRLLLERGADPNAPTTTGRQATPLHCAALRGHLAAVRLLLAGGADVNVADRGGETALHLACRSHDSSMQALLAEHGADSDRVSRCGQTPSQVGSAPCYSEGD
jgi:ankyrin repeat protein